jgi:histidinol-phosphatase (PHP family)
MWSNYHTHSHYCDGKGTMVDYLEAAKKHGVQHIGFSSHAHVPFPCKWCMKEGAFSGYLREIESASKTFAEINVYRGLEVDFIPGVMGPTDFTEALDYTIGSIHFVEAFRGKRWEIDNTSEVFREGLTNIFDGDIRAAISRYYSLTREMVTKSPPDILGHMDKIKINAGPFFNESQSWYIDEVDKTLALIRETNIVVEVNTRGLYKKKAETTYPSPWILERILSMGMPITLSSDAHHPDDLISEFRSTHAMLGQIGFKDISVLSNGMWNKMPLNEYGPGR